MHESPAEIAQLQELLDRSYASAGAHLLSIHTAQRRLTAEQLSECLTGMRLLALATVTEDGRPIIGPVDGIFYRGAFHFGSSPDSVRMRHIGARPQVSATHLPGEELAVTVHGRAISIDVGAPENTGFRQTLLDVYLPRYGEGWEQFLNSGPVYARIEAERMFGFYMPAGEGPEFARPLREEDVDRDPFRQFAAWFEQARARGMRAPEAAAIATATATGRPSVRMVLVKQADTDGFVFYSGHESRKGRELSGNPVGALLFYWEPLGRQVRVEGKVLKLTNEESADYIRSRPRASQISALASPQSQVVASRRALEERVAELAAEYDDALPLPETWGGYRLLPESFEFWQHREDRLHDRLLYTPADEGSEARQAGEGSWRLERLAP